MSNVEFVKVKAQDDGMRLNRWFLKYYPNLPLSRLQKLLRTKQIKVDGKKADVSLKLAEGQEVRIPPMEDKVEIVDKRE
ncbi:MAG: RluA family pseudouridine synthase, partial [Alphaproteobacteria bacterium]|nr:RluA family pseudouridine synthase [Alphaproteobacteria bacterium]